MSTHLHEKEFEADIFGDRVAVVFNYKRVSGRKTTIDLICLFQYTALHNKHAIKPFCTSHHLTRYDADLLTGTKSMNPFLTGLSVAVNSLLKRFILMSIISLRPTAPTSLSPGK